MRLPDGLLTGEDIVTAFPQHRVRQVAAAALGRAVLLTRAGVCLTSAVVVAVVTPGEPRALAVVAVILAATAAQTALLRTISRYPVAALAADALVALAVLGLGSDLSGAGVTFFAYLAGSAALAGALLGTAATPLWAAQVVQGLVAVVAILRRDELPPSLIPLVLILPMLCVPAGLAVALARRSLTRQVSRELEQATAAAREAAAAERARLARELHDSVAKTLRAVSLAAVALPGSVHRQPALAEQLAETISRGADTANAEARKLIQGFRLDTPEEAFAATLERMCALWSAESGIAVSTTLAPVEPLLSVRYELARIMHEALTNVARHSTARRVGVVLAQRGRGLTLSVQDDGRGFSVPEDASALQYAGHAGIVGMIERARSVGGTLTIDSRLGAGTVIRVRVPDAAAEVSA